MLNCICVDCRASASQFERVAVVTDIDSAELVALGIQGYRVSLSEYERRTLAAKALGACAALDMALASQMLRGAVPRAEVAGAAIVQQMEASKSTKTVISYKDAGVDIVAGDQLVEMIKPACAATARPGCDASLGGFGALFDLAAAGYDSSETILVSGTDGVGTKLLIAQQTGIHITIGIDLVAMSVNDVLVTGAEPLFFLDYFGCGKLDLGVGAQVVLGIAEGCKQSRCGLTGGETAEMPAMYPPGEYDLAGFAVGAVRRSKLLPKDVAAGDVVLGLPSSGVHSNGYSLVRKCVERSGLPYSAECPFAAGKTLGEALLTPTRIYVEALMDLIKDGLINALAHITGGGLLENVPRVIPADLSVHVDMESAGWVLPPVFRWLMDVCGIDQEEMLTTFNCGIGMVVVVAPQHIEAVKSRLVAKGEPFLTLGSVGVRQSGSRQVVVSGNFL
jgi:phosphoribosylaminoimidazole synthetase